MDIMKEKKYNFIYRTENIYTNDIYIGVHTTDDLNDGYVGNGIKKISTARYNAKNGGKKLNLANYIMFFGLESFKTEVLCFYDTEKDAYKAEEALVDKLFIKKSNVYNITTGGKKPPTHFGKGETHFNYGRKQTPEQIEQNRKQALARNLGGVNNPSYKGKVYCMVGMCPIAVFESTVAAEIHTGVDRKSISSCINGGRITSKGFRWARDIKKTQEQVDSGVKSYYELVARSCKRKKYLS